MLREKEFSVMRVLFGLSSWAGKAYCFPSQKKIVKLSKKWCGVGMSRRTLNRVLLRLEEGSWVDRVKRHCKGPSGSIVFHSTLYRLKGKSFNWAYGLGAWSSRLFSTFRVPRLAQYKALTPEGHHRPVDGRANDERPMEEGAARSAPIVLTFRTV